MQCPRCQQTQPAQARFCSNCGNAMPVQGAPVQPQPQPAPPYQAYQQPYQQPAQPPQYYPPYQAPYQPVQARTVMGFPLHVWLVTAAAIALLALFLPWYSTQTSYGVKWNQSGYKYSDGTSSTWYVPTASNSQYGGGNGLNVFTLALAATIAGLALKFRSGAWPRWAGYTLAVVVGLVTFVGVINLLSDPNLGPILFAAAGGLAIPAVLQTLQRK